MISIINYGLGNVNAFANILKNLNLTFNIATKKEDLVQSKKIILPGVGSFDWAMKKINKSGMRETLDELVLNKKVLVLGICVGMQIMAKTSEEGKERGLSWVDAEIIKFKNTELNNLPIPHMGWNKTILKPDDLFNEIKEPRFYFLHSYYIRPIDERIIIGKTHYKKEFACAIKSSENIYGVQFHPEKSLIWGQNLIRNFALI